MYQTIDQQVQVIGTYHHSFTPHKFKWQQRVIPIKEITLISDTRNGQVKKRIYSVIDSNNIVYRLEFNRDSEQWWLREVWVE